MRKPKRLEGCLSGGAWALALACAAVRFAACAAEGEADGVGAPPPAAVSSNAEGRESAADMVTWPEPSRGMKPWIYNWWPMGEVDESGFEFQSAELRDKGFGGFNVIPLGCEEGEIWARSWRIAERKAREHDLCLDFGVRDASPVPGEAGPPLVAGRLQPANDRHFCTTPADLKIAADRLFLSGANQLFYSGLCYSSVDAPWPGDSCCASQEINPRNPIWREIGAVNAYITRCQSMLQTWWRSADAAPSPFAPETGVLATRLEKDGKTLYFIVNASGEAREVYSDKPFVAMNPMTGMIRETDRFRIEPNHSRFAIGDAFAVRESVTPAVERSPVAGPWRVVPVEGGPDVPAVRVLRALNPAAGWEAWDDAFSGTMLYTTMFDSDSAARVLSLGDVREVARVRLNGLDLGVRFMKPYFFFLPPGLIKEKGNVIEVEVTSLGANRLRWCVTTGGAWNRFCEADAAPAEGQDHDASAWSIVPSGLLGPVEIIK